MIKEVLLFLSSLVYITSSAPLYGQDGGYKGYASYVPRKALNRISHNSKDNIDASAGSPAIKIMGNPSSKDEDSSSYGSRKVLKKYEVSEYVPTQQNGYGDNRITDEIHSSPYHRATIYRQTQGGFKMADTYRTKNMDSNSEHNSNEDISNSQPYEFGYTLKDKHGNQQYRYENRNGEGRVQGNYGYKDKYGIFRNVQYVADKEGFRASIKTNEPGTESQDPAHVVLQAETS